MEHIFNRARAAVIESREVRAAQRRQRRPDRCSELNRMLEAVRASAREIKRERNRSTFEAREERLYGQRLRAASNALRHESRLLRKMRTR